MRVVVLNMVCIINRQSVLIHVISSSYRSICKIYYIYPFFFSCKDKKENAFG